MKSIPDHCQPYKRTPTFSETNVPTGLLNAHQTKEGTWGKIVILEGRLLYRILEPQIEEHILDTENAGIVEPENLHEVEPQGQVSFYVEFYK